MNLKLFNLARSANGVKRYHTVTNVITPETVGHHTAGVIGILFCIYDQEPSLRLIEAALYHDTPEYVTGDMPATAKWDFPDLNLALDTAEQEIVGSIGYSGTLTEEEMYVLKFADLMDLAMKSYTEVMCGNGEFVKIMQNGAAAAGELLREHLPAFANAHNFYEVVLGELNAGQR